MSFNRDSKTSLCCSSEARKTDVGVGMSVEPWATGDGEEEMLVTIQEQNILGLGSHHPLRSAIMQWQVPRKVILSKKQLEYFQESKTYQDIISYIETLNSAVIGAKLTDECTTSSVSWDY